LTKGLSYQPGVDGLRSVAVMTVVLFHVAPNLVPGGFVGVDVFFVISGFLISRNIRSDLRTGKFSLIDFYIRRIRRIAPALIVTVAVSSVLAFLVLAPRHFEQFARSVIYSLLSVANIFFWKEAGYFDTSAEFKPLLHLWTLGVEEQFYFVWPTVLVALFWLRGRALPIGLVLLGIVSLAASQYVVERNPTTAFYMTPFRIWEFILGALCLWAPPASRWTKELLLIAGIALIIGASFFYSPETTFPGLTALVPCIGAALAICAGDAEKAGVLLRNRIAVGIGLISYSLYLVHWPIYVFYRYWILGSISTAEQVGIVIVSIALAALSYRYVEQPFRRKESHRDLFWSWRTAAAVALFVLAAGPAIHASQNEGWPWRLGGQAQAFWQQIKTRDQSMCKMVDIAPSVQGCAFGSGAKDYKQFDVVLVGDSHAVHWIAGLHELFKDRSITAISIFDAGSLPLKNLTNYRNKVANSRASQIAQAIETFVQSARPSVVILSARWSIYETATMPPGDNRARRFLTYGEGDTLLSPEQSSAALRKALFQTAEDYRKEGIHTIVLGQVPFIGFNTLECLTRPKWLSSSGFDYRRCNSLANAKALAELGPTDRILGDLRDAFPDSVTLYLPSDFVCKKDLGCEFLSARGTLYRDADHLSIDGSIHLAQRHLTTLPEVVKAHWRNRNCETRECRPATAAQ